MLRHAKIQSPLAKARSALSGVWRNIFARLGRYTSISNQRRKLVPVDEVCFRGDIPIHAGNEQKQTRLAFAQAPPPFEDVKDLVVTPIGAGFVDGVLYEKYSAEKPGLRALVSGGAPTKTIDRAYFVQAEHRDTFGDWMAEYLTPLACLGNIDAPVLLPETLAARSYVQRDMSRFDIAFDAITERTLIKNARVVRQSRFVRYWTQGETTALRSLLKADPPAPDPGSIIYLSRYGEKSNVAERTHPNLIAEKVVRAHGGKVLRTADAGLSDYLDAAQSAETVVFDHGSAGYNMIYWQPKRVIEVVTDDWWLNAFVFFADAIGVPDYGIIRSDLGGDARVEKKLKELLAAPLMPAKP